jgi:predicted anti-sigma-YlaC factor YlaD
MPTELHATICNLIDKSLAGAASPQEEQAIREHLPTCADCTEYLDASHRAIAGLDVFRFEVDPNLESKILVSLAARAQQLQAKNTEHGPVREWSWVAAVVLTIAGSFAAFEFGGVAASLLHIEPARWQIGFTTIWILPSLFVCLLFLLLPAATSTAVHEKGMSL